MDHDRRYIKVATALHDDDTHERRSRINKVWREAEQARKARWKRLCDGAAVLGIEKSESEHGLDGGYESIISEAMAVMHELDKGSQAAGTESHWVGRFSASVWVFISGMSHPSMSRGWAGSLHESGEIGADGFMRVTSAGRTLRSSAMRSWWHCGCICGRCAFRQMPAEHPGRARRLTRSNRTVGRSRPRVIAARDHSTPPHNARSIRSSSSS
jgi:hypothetical protein